jgi:hypothetical protein
LSPLADGQTIYDKDSIFRDERGRLHMAHVLSFIAGIVGAGVAIAGVVAVFVRIDAGAHLVNAGLGLVGAGAGLEYGQSRIERDLQRGA